MKYPILLLSLLLALPQLQAYAQSNEQPAESAAPKVQSGEVVEPEVTIVEEEGRTVHQYSVNGHVYMVKIVPAGNFPPTIYWILMAMARWMCAATARMILRSRNGFCFAGRGLGDGVPWHSGECHQTVIVYTV